jgi:hypothetical protein
LPLTATDHRGSRNLSISDTFLISPEPISPEHARRQRRARGGCPAQQLRQSPKLRPNGLICHLNLTDHGDTKFSMWRDYLCKIVNLNWENSI